MYWTTLQILLALLTSATLGLMIAGVVAWAIKALGAKWIDEFFQKRLERFRTDKQKEIEGLKYRINQYADRAVKFHQLEFDVLPTAWGKLIDAYAHFESLAGLVAPANLSGMTEPQFEAYLRDSDFSESAKEALRSTTDKDGTLLRLMRGRQLAECQDAWRHAHFQILRSSILMPPAVRHRFRELDDMMRRAVSEHFMSHRHPNVVFDHKGHGRLMTEGKTKLDELEKLLEDQLSDFRVRDFSPEQP